MSELIRYRQQASVALAEHEHARRQVKDEKSALADAEEELASALTAQKVVQEVAAGVQQATHTQIARVVTKCLQAIFDDPYEFRVVFEQKRGKTEARLVYARDGHEFDPTTEAGGGVVDVTAFALRLTKVVLQRPPLRRALLLDEPMRMLSRDYAPRFRELLIRLAEEMGFQFVVVTHSPVLAAGKVVEL